MLLLLVHTVHHAWVLDNVWLLVGQHRFDVVKSDARGERLDGLGLHVLLSQLLVREQLLLGLLGRQSGLFPLTRFLGRRLGSIDSGLRLRDLLLGQESGVRALGSRKVPSMSQLATEVDLHLACTVRGHNL